MEVGVRSTIVGVTVRAGVNVEVGESEGTGSVEEIGTSDEAAVDAREGVNVTGSAGLIIRGESAF